MSERIQEKANRGVVRGRKDPSWIGSACWCRYMLSLVFVEQRTPKDSNGTTVSEPRREHSG